MSDNVSEEVVLQRVRNRIIEVLELFSDDDNFQLAISNLEYWEDWVSLENLKFFLPPVFTESEVSEIRSVHIVWEQVYPSTQRPSEEWLALTKAAKHALSIFYKRGLLPEDSEIA